MVHPSSPWRALDKNCARCHQAGPSLQRQKPAKNFGNVLALDEIARDPDLILPGNPDGSGLFTQIAKKDMPYDCYQEFDCEAEPTEEDVKAVYDWIKGLGDTITAVCGDRAPLDEAAVVTAIAKVIDAQEEMKKLLAQDALRFRKAMLAAGLDPDLDLQTQGVESINFLSKAYEKSVDLRVAAAEYGIRANALSQSFTDAGGAFGRIKRRLEQGVLPRQILEVEFPELVAKVSDNKPIEIAALTPTAFAQTRDENEVFFDDFDLALISDKSNYRVNDLPVFSIKSSKGCINVEAGGDGTVIFPNTFQQDNLLPANTEMKFPDADAPFQFRLKDPGTETVIAICNATGVGADGIEHDFKTRQFTPLGNYRQFLTRRIVVEGAAKVAAGQKHKVSANNAPDGAETSGPEAADDASEDLARTAIKLVVR